MSMQGLRTVYTIVLVVVCLLLGAAAAHVYHVVQDHRACVDVMTYLGRPTDTC